MWCQSQAMWLNLALVARLEDLQGAVEERQHGLVRYSAMAIGEDCAVMLAFSTHNEQPLPVRSMRAAWALSRIAEHELYPDCWRLMRSFDTDESDADIQAACEALVSATRAIFGDVPNGLTHDGYFPVLALTREWHQLLDTLGQSGFFPQEWTRRTSGAQAT